MTTRSGTSAPDAVIDAQGLAKRFGSTDAVIDATVTALAGRVTGFIGPNGAGKSTTMKMITGLVRPDRGSASVTGKRYRDLPRPATVIGVALDTAAHPATTARNHLRIQAALADIPNDRVDRVLHDVGLSDAADRPLRGFSTGMRQRLALATALIGDPAVLMLDEPSNGLDPAGIVWLRRQLRSFADAGGSVLVSSHVLTELQYVIDDLVLIDGGRTRWSGALSDFTDSYASLEEAFLANTGTQVGDTIERPEESRR